MSGAEVENDRLSMTLTEEDCERIRGKHKTTQLLAMEGEMNVLLLPYLAAKYGSEVAGVWSQYLSAGSPILINVSDQNHPFIQGSSVSSRGFLKSKVTLNLEDLLGLRLDSRNVKQTGAAQNLADGLDYYSP